MNKQSIIIRHGELISLFLTIMGITAFLNITLTASAFASTDGPAELPRVYVNSSMASTAAPGSKTIVPAGANLQQALKNAHCGDTLLLQAGATFTGNFNFPAKPCDAQHWIIVRTSAADSALPPEGTRISPCYAGVTSLPGRPSFPCSTAKKVMARLVGNTAGPIIFYNGSNHYRLGPGLEITRPVNSKSFNNLIGPNGTASSIVIDRDWIHGIPLYDTMRGVMLSGITNAAVVNSYINDFHCAAVIGTCVDSQAIAGGGGSRPQGIWKISNNFLEGAAETILFGGVIANSVTPGDIEITKNHMFKPLTWMPGQPGFVGTPNANTSKCRSTPGRCPFIVKNLIELKNAQRVLVEGNILENVWAGFTQHGASILVQGMNTVDAATYSTVSVTDVTFRYNRVAHGASGFSIANPPANSTTANLPVYNISMHDMIFDDINSVYKNGDTSGTWATELLYCPFCSVMHDIQVNHITEVINNPKNIFAVIGASIPIQSLSITNSIFSVSPGLVVNGSGDSNPCAFTGATNLSRLSACADPLNFRKNALIAGTGTWPAGNFFPQSPAAVRFVSYNNGNGGNYTLLSTSPYHNAGTDGKDLA